jgi:hypothetical protein
LRFGPKIIDELRPRPTVSRRHQEDDVSNRCANTEAPLKVKRFAQRLAIGLLAAILSASCWLAPAIPGDRSHDVTIANPSDASVILYDVGREHPDQSRTIAPHETKVTQWLVSADHSDSVTQKVEATDTNGNLIFCHRYTYNELTQLNWHVTLRPGQLECG